MRTANKLEKFFMKTALDVADLSYAKRRKVGAVIVKDDRIISTGYNRTPAGFDNSCEIEEYYGELKTKPEVIHAEANAIFFCAKNGISTDGTELYLTLSPCNTCALAIIQSGIKKVFFLDAYRDLTGVEILKKAGICVEQLTIA